VIHAATQASSRFDMTDRRRVLLDTTAFIDYVQTKSSREVSADELAAAIRAGVVVPVLVNGQYRFSKRMGIKWVRALKLQP
jgi:hypothetical protein